MVAEGCYHYSIGGVSSWIDNMIRIFPNVEFVLLTIVANREAGGKFKYDLPPNVTEVHEVYLEDVDWEKKKNSNNRRSVLTKKEFSDLRALVLNMQCD